MACLIPKEKGYLRERERERERVQPGLQLSPSQSLFARSTLITLFVKEIKNYNNFFQRFKIFAKGFQRGKVPEYSRIFNFRA
jgi:hypothetical protein